MKKIYLFITTVLFLLPQSLMAQIDENIGEFDEDEAVFVTNDKGEREEIDLPESMTYELDSLLYDYHQKTYLSPDESCNLPDVNPSFTDEEIISRLKRLPTIM